MNKLTLCLIGSLGLLYGLFLIHHLRSLHDNSTANASTRALSLKN